MKRLYIIVEGPTEEEFVKELLAPYLADAYGIFDVRPIKIRTSKNGKGGLVNYQHLYNDALRYLQSEQNIVVTTFIDFFRLPTSMPSYHPCQERFTRTDDKINCLEEAMQQSINYPNFIPYIQKHEFEALLFSDNSGFEEYYGYNEKIIKAINVIIEKYDNPEEINDAPNTAPSKRIIQIMRENDEKYDKILDGNTIALEVGLSEIRAKCPRFSRWIEQLINEVTT